MALFTGNLTVILTLATMLIFHGLCVPSSLTLPALSTSPSLLNSSSLATPSAFKIEPVWNTSNPIDSTAFYMNAIELLYLLSTCPLNKLLSKVKLVFENYGLEIQALADPRRSIPMTTNHVLWGLLYIAFSMAVTGRYTGLTAVLKWEGQPVGNLQIRPFVLMLKDLSQTEGTDLGFALPLINTTALQEDKEIVRTTVTFTDMEIDKEDIFLTVLRAIGAAMEAGRDTFAPGQYTVGIHGVAWFLNAIISDIPLKHRHVIEAARQTISQMVEQNKSTGMTIVVTVNGIETAEGGLGVREIPPSYGVLLPP